MLAFRGARYCSRDAYSARFPIVMFFMLAGATDRIISEFREYNSSNRQRMPLRNLKMDI